MLDNRPKNVEKAKDQRNIGLRKNNKHSMDGACKEKKGSVKVNGYREKTYITAEIRCTQ